MNPPMTELSYQAIRTANQAREAVKYILGIVKKDVELSVVRDPYCTVVKQRALMNFSEFYCIDRLNVEVVQVGHRPSNEG